MVDCGDVDIAYYDIETNRRSITGSVKKLLERGAFPVIVGGDHSVTFPNIEAFSRYRELDVVQIDAHMDWRDSVGGVRYANASPMRRAKELPFVRNMAQIGIRDIRTSEDQVADAEASGSIIITRQTVREMGPAAAANLLPPLADVFVTIDIDGLDPSIAPGTGSPTADGLLYHEVMAILRSVVRRGNVVGFDLVEVNPMVGDHGRTCLLATTLILEFLGAIFERRNAAT